MDSEPSWKPDRDDLELIVATVQRYPDATGDTILARLPMSRQRALNLVRKYEKWLSRRLGRKVRYSPPSYRASGSGPFGRYGSNRGKYCKATFYLD